MIIIEVELRDPRTAQLVFGLAILAQIESAGVRTSVLAGCVRFGRSRFISDKIARSALAEWIADDGHGGWMWGGSGEEGTKWAVEEEGSEAAAADG